MIAHAAEDETPPLMMNGEERECLRDEASKDHRAEEKTEVEPRETNLSLRVHGAESPPGERSTTRTWTDRERSDEIPDTETRVMDQ
ncbi:unnamed protein product [Boreogadus saida]